jgi:hypothetical protein
MFQFSGFLLQNTNIIHYSKCTFCNTSCNLAKKSIHYSESQWDISQELLDIQAIIWDETITGKWATLQMKIRSHGDTVLGSKAFCILSNFLFETWQLMNTQIKVCYTNLGLCKWSCFNWCMQIWCGISKWMWQPNPSKLYPCDQINALFSFQNL